MNDRKWYKTYTRLKKEQGYTDYRVAKELGLARSTVCEWQKDGRYPNVPTLIELAKLFKVPITDFL